MKIPIPDQVPTLDELGAVHFIGIGGAGLSGIAHVMVERGVRVTGSDNQNTPFLEPLRALGVPVTVGYAAEHVGDADTVVVTTAAADDNPEVVEARERGLRMLPRSTGLVAAMSGRRVLAVAGTHGKTTTTSLLTSALLASGARPGYAIGGVLSSTGLNAEAGSEPWFVAEADESDGAFLAYHPHAAIVTGIDADHLDHWGTEEAYAAAFDEFADSVDDEGVVVCCTDDAGAAGLAERLRTSGRLVVAVGTAADCDYRADDIVIDADGSRFTLVHRGDRVGEVRLQILGRHYVTDALAALALGMHLGFDFAELAAGLADFAGTRRRMESKGIAGGVAVYDTYAHHPAEIAADLEAARAVAGAGRVIAVFQPHLPSRTRIFAGGMGKALSVADVAVVLEVYTAREMADPDVNAALVAAHVGLPDEFVYVGPTADEVPALVAGVARPGDLVITLGAGDVTELGPRILAACEEAR